MMVKRCRMLVDVDHPLTGVDQVLTDVDRVLTDVGRVLTDVDVVLTDDGRSLVLKYVNRAPIMVDRILWAHELCILMCLTVITCSPFTRTPSSFWRRDAGS